MFAFQKLPIVWITLALVTCWTPRWCVAEDDSSATARSATDDERIALLKREITLEEALRTCRGKRLFGQGCGLGRDEYGTWVSAVNNVFEFKLADGTKFYLRLSSVGKNLAGITGPGFRYLRTDGKYLRTEVPLIEKEPRIELPE